MSVKDGEVRVGGDNYLGVQGGSDRPQHSYKIQQATCEQGKFSLYWADDGTQVDRLRENREFYMRWVYNGKTWYLHETDGALTIQETADGQITLTASPQQFVYNGWTFHDQSGNYLRFGDDSDHYLTQNNAVDLDTCQQNRLVHSAYELYYYEKELMNRQYEYCVTYTNSLDVSWRAYGDKINSLYGKRINPYSGNGWKLHSQYDSYANIVKNSMLKGCGRFKDTFKLASMHDRNRVLDQARLIKNATGQGNQAMADAIKEFAPQQKSYGDSGSMNIFNAEIAKTYDISQGLLKVAGQLRDLKNTVGENMEDYWMRQANSFVADTFKIRDPKLEVIPDDIVPTNFVWDDEAKWEDPCAAPSFVESIDLTQKSRMFADA